MNKKINLLAGIAVAAVFLLVFNISAFSYRCSEIRSNVIRLHIIANSDTEADQDIKLKVRDAILQESASIFDGSVNIENASDKIIPELEHIENIANKIIEINKRNYKAEASLVYEYFDTRTYNDSVTLPAGKYLALKVELGEAEGKNWWCVMFPSLCLPAAEKSGYENINQVFENDELNIIQDKSKYEVRFKIIELLESLKSKGDKIRKGDIV